MFRAPVPLRHALVAAMLVAVPALPAASAHAQTATLNFNTLTDPGNVGVRYVPNCYAEQGYVVTVVGVACSDQLALATAGPADPLLYTGTPALFLNNGTGVNLTGDSGSYYAIATDTPPYGYTDFTGASFGSFAVSPVSEPSSLLTVALGLAAGALIRRKKPTQS